ncbi:O-methyltransferase-like protein family 3 [Phaeosphaeria sp. MPI-PUGE-AT-0046c]|nr:O-methyltransferase-like protein family 3 [Phaeosphaeria sp. MPI-PUGE-AT-0046c]
MNTTSHNQGYDADPRWNAVDEYAFSHLHPNTSIPSNSVLEHVRSASEEAGLPDIAVSPPQGKYLQLQARLVRAKNVLEIGTLGGYSTIWLAHACPDTKVTSVEVNEHHTNVARANVEYAGIADRVEVQLGPGMEVLPQLAEEVKTGKREKFQFVFIDADKSNNWNYVDIALGMCESGACVVVDNVVREGRLAQDLDDASVQGARRVVEKIGKDKRLDGMVLQTVGDKSYDGFLFAVVR